jgi:exodeoxyribonuclease VII small subunit
MTEDADGTADEAETEGDGEPDDSGVDPEAVDERIRRVETIVRALESGDVDPEERAARIAEGKELVAELERDLETVERETADDETDGDETEE